MLKTAELKYCHECGVQINIKAEICPACGVRQPHNAYMDSFGFSEKHSIIGQGKPRDKNTAAALALILGGLGVHKFYLGKPIWGAVYILFVWTFIPAIFGLIEGLNYYFMSKEVFAKRYSGPAFSS